MKNTLLTCCAAVMALSASIQAATFFGPVPYLSTNDSPFLQSFQEGSMLFEDFEDGALNSLGLIASSGLVLGPNGPFVGLNDSVDADDGEIDGRGTGGHSFFTEADSLTFTFDITQLGDEYPWHAGLVWTDGAPGSTVTFEALDRNGNSLGTIGPVMLADNEISGTTAEDRFFGVIHNGGISAIRVTHTVPGIEVDHIQYGRSATLGQPPAEMKLSLSRPTATTIEISWPAPGSDGFVLESTQDLGSPNWSPVAPAPTVAGGSKSVTVDITGEAQYFRLRR